MRDKKQTTTTRPQLIACVIKQYGTGLYRACVSLGEDAPVCLGTHQEETCAAALVDRFLETYRQGQVKTHADVLTFSESVHSQGFSAPLTGPATA